MAASVWTGYLTFGLISMPVRLFSGARGERVGFHMLHREDHARLKQQYICSEDGKVVGRDDTVKGFEWRKGQYVIVEPEEIKKVEPKTSKAMEILEFVKADEVDPIYYESSYYLVPEEAGRRPYALLVRALQETNYVAVAKLTMHNREYTVILRPYENGMMLHTMYYANEVRRLESFGEKQADLKDAEVKIAHQLIEALAGPFQPEKYHDTFEDNIKQLIQAKVEGKEITAVEKPKPQPSADLMEALKLSLAQMEKKPPQRAQATASQGVEAETASGAGAPAHPHAPRKRASTKRGRSAA
jgi:DNA end-binding protein Ku